MIKINNSSTSNMESLALSPEMQSLKDMLDGISTANQSTLNALGGTLTTGSISKECEYFKNDNCSAGDMCPYTHSGRERQQNTEAVKLEKMKESEKENTDNLSSQGMGGLRRRMP